MLNGSNNEVRAWLNGPHNSSTFQDRPLIAAITSGCLIDVLSVRRVLELALQATYIAPNAVERPHPYRDEDTCFMCPRP